MHKYRSQWTSNIVVISAGEYLCLTYKMISLVLFDIHSRRCVFNKITLCRLRIKRKIIRISMFTDNNSYRMGRQPNEQDPRLVERNPSGVENSVTGTNSSTNNESSGHQQWINSNIVTSDLMPNHLIKWIWTIWNGEMYKHVMATFSLNSKIHQKKTSPVRDNKYEEI